MGQDVLLIKALVRVFLIDEFWGQGAAHGGVGGFGST